MENEGSAVCTDVEVADEHVAVGVGVLGNATIRPMAFGGHCFYVRKCMTGDAVEGGDPQDRMVDGIFLPQQAADRSLAVEVLALGPRVGRPCSDAHMKLHQRDRVVGGDVKVGDMLVCPNMHPTGIKRSPLCEYEFFIEETVPLYAIERDEAQ